MRPQAVLHSSLVMCVSRSQRAKQSFARLRPSAAEALLELAAMEFVTVTDGQGALVGATGTVAAAGVAGAGFEMETGAGGAAACAPSMGSAGGFFTELELASAAGCFVSALRGLTAAPVLPVAPEPATLRGSM
jgi:hypothetical protein